MTEFLEIFLIAFTIFSESLHESFYDKICVASVIYNRASDKEFDYYRVITKPKQFSCHNTWPGINNNLKKIRLRKFEWFICVFIASTMVNDRFKPVLQARHYARIETKCVWMKDMIIEQQNRNHKYLIKKIVK